MIISKLVSDWFCTETISLLISFVIVFNWRYYCRLLTWSMICWHTPIANPIHEPPHHNRFVSVCMCQSSSNQHKCVNRHYDVTSEWWWKWWRKKTKKNLKRKKRCEQIQSRCESAACKICRPVYRKMSLTQLHWCFMQNWVQVTKSIARHNMETKYLSSLSVGRVELRLNSV